MINLIPFFYLSSCWLWFLMLFLCEHALMYMLNIKLMGHYRYYGISFNSKMICNFRQRIWELLFKVLNRRSDKKSYTRDGFNQMLKYYPIATPKIYVSLHFWCEFYYEEPYAGKLHVRFCEGLTLWGVGLLDCGYCFCNLLRERMTTWRKRRFLQWVRAEMCNLISFYQRNWWKMDMK